MKKLISLLLTLCLLCGVVALADTTINQGSDDKTATTTVSYTIEANDSYTVTIPSSVTLTAGGNTLSSSMQIKLDATSFNVPRKQIVVKLTAAAMKLVDDTSNEIPYTITLNDTTVNVNDAVLTWHSSNAAKTAYAKLSFSATLDNQPAGSYSDTLTFTVSVEDAVMGGAD